jgi:hypothetical protein
VRRAAVALLHHPVLDRQGEIFTTTITNLDLHDISRTVRTYGLEAFFVVHPFEAQRALAERIKRHWVEGPGGVRIPPRREALAILRLARDLDEVRQSFGEAEIWTTAAKAHGPVTDFSEARARLERPGKPVLLCFGTGWGLAPSLLEGADLRLAPIDAGHGFNHLSVRAACAIAIDRLFSAAGH